MQRFYGAFRDAEGRGYPGASVYVYNAGTSVLPQLYSASGDIVAPPAIANPLFTDANGLYGFAIPNGTYDIQITGGSMPTEYISNLTIGTTDITTIEASSVTNAPSGTISATNVQAAINELDIAIGLSVSKAAINELDIAIGLSVSKSDLASTASASLNSGMVGYDNALSYGASTIGKAVQDLENDPSISVNNLQEQTYIAFTTTGTAPAFVLTPTPALASLAIGKPRFNVLFHAAGTTPTLDVSGLGAKNVKQYDSSGVKIAAITTANMLTDCEYDGTDWVILNPLTLAASGHGECYLSLDTGNLKLSRMNGSCLMIDGKVYSIPYAGVTLTPAGLTADTTYYVYAYMSAGVMTLEAATTGHVLDAATGVEVKIGDATRTLVGLTRVIGGPAFVDTETYRFVLSYFNRKEKYVIGNVWADRTDNNYGSYQLTNAADRMFWLTWGSEPLKIKTAFRLKNGSTGNSYVALTLDTTTYNTAISRNDVGYIATNAVTAYESTYAIFNELTNNKSVILAEGFHYLAIWGKGSTSANWYIQACKRAYLEQTYGPCISTVVMG